MLKVIYTDNHLLALDKPAGLTTQGGLDDLAKAWIKEQCNKPGKVFLEPIHRLDRSVSGIVLFARTSKALSRLNAAMRDREIVKVYRAWVEGQPPSSSGTVEHFLVHDEFHARIVAPTHPAGKKALLDYRLIKACGQLALLEIILHTGRYHQIRAQLAALGCPIAGDKKYGAKTSRETIGLRHIRMQLVHPVTLVPITLEAPAT